MLDNVYVSNKFATDWMNFQTALRCGWAREAFGMFGCIECRCIDLATVFKTVGGREAAVELTGKYSQRVLKTVARSILTAGLGALGRLTEHRRLKCNVASPTQ
jgi:hypothetical protein